MQKNVTRKIVFTALYYRGYGCLKVHGEHNASVCRRRRNENFAFGFLFKIAGAFVRTRHRRNVVFFK